MRQLNNLESFLYKFIIELSNLNAPIVFKGGLVLKSILQKNNKEMKINRQTIDIDGNWTSEYNREKICDIVNQALKNINKNYKVVLVREPNTKTSLGLKIVNEYNEIITKIDLDIKDNPFYIIFNINNTNIKYSSIEKIAADKLYVLSGNHLFRRTKDILDLYLIISTMKVDIKKVKEILKYDSHKLGTFSQFKKDKTELKKAYENLKGVENKPDFEFVYDTILEFLRANNLLVL